MAGDVLIVRHGPGRGRELAIWPSIEAHIASTRPAFRSRLRSFDTGSKQPSLDGVGAILFLLGDPLKELYPDCYSEAVAIAESGASRGIRLLNPPQNLSTRVKSRQAELWRKAGLGCAATRVIRSPADLEPAMAALGLPMILRSDDEHAQERVKVCKRVKHVDEAKLTLRTPAVALQLIDVRAKWRAVAPDNVMARYHHRKRSMVCGDTVINDHVLFATTPIVGRTTSTFLADSTGPRSWFRRLGMGRARWQETIAIDYEYFRSSPEAPEIMLRAVKALGLDFAAIDYASLPNGEVVLWEANPYVHLPSWQQEVAADPRRMRERTSRQIEVVVDWLERLADGRA